MAFKGVPARHAPTSAGTWESAQSNVSPLKYSTPDGTTPSSITHSVADKFASNVLPGGLNRLPGDVEGGSIVGKGRHFRGLDLGHVLRSVDCHRSPNSQSPTSIQKFTKDFTITNLDLHFILCVEVLDGVDVYHMHSYVASFPQHHLLELCLWVKH
ncbi:hypothetical protein E2C01_003603 [Portunus trituberculatus]|uniref:Uncharacterized protein n=1 Tax=Portunus trituberculatus TaxID=210409 RepID=A0A5B7CP81_PORTR|nr:hypothetical protein [Portunus trituberculatus]